MNRPLRILCADDNILLGEILVCLFAKEGFWIEHVDDGAKAWERLAPDVHSFDVIITDHNMPLVSGLQLVERLRAANYRGRIIVHSSSLTSDMADQYRALGAQRIVPKAAKPYELLNAIAP